MPASRTIQQTTRVLATMVIATFLIAAVVIGVALSQIRLGGAMDRQNQLNAEFLGDILPPPLFLVEPMLHATWLAADPDQAAEHIAELESLEKVYRTRLDYWKVSDLNPELRQVVPDRLVPLGEKFWNQVHGDLIPAVQSRDAARIAEAHRRIEQVYRDYKHEIDTLVAMADKANTTQHGSSATVSTMAMAALVVLGVVMLGELIWAMRTVRNRALQPLGETAEIMTRMAAGDLDAGQTDSHRNDEIGEMTRAIEVFRAASRKQLAGTREQQLVVETLGEALGRVAEGNLTVQIDQRFAAEYEPLRETFNLTVARLAAVIREVAETASSVNLGASEILTAADDLAARNERQAGSVEETAAAMR